MQELASRLEEGPAFFPEDAVTDQTERQLVAEFIREKALRTLDKEVPHGTPWKSRLLSKKAKTWCTLAP